MPQSFRIDNPYSGEIVADRRFATAQEIESIVARAHRAQRGWARVALPERVASCERFCAAFERDGERIAREITAQMGKPLAQARGEVKTCLSRARHMMSIAAESLRDEPLPPIPGFTRFIQNAPVGVVLDISAWNYPLLITVNVVVPAVLAGNAVLVKHATRTALCGEAFARAFAEAGAPEGLVQAVHADHDVCARIAARPEIGFVSFTGSVRGGHEVYRAVAQTRFIDVGLELGGKDPAYVAPDADLDYAVVNLVDGAFYNAGQSCCGIERIYVHASVYDRFLEGAVAETRNLRMGDPLDEGTTLGPMAQPDAPARLEAQIAEARSKGGRVLCGGKATSVEGKGRFFDPCVVSDATHQMHGLMVEESFGPIVGIARVASDDEAVRLMNDSPYGPTASIWTRDEERAFRVGSQIETGTFFMNRCDYLDPALPWTGVKDSGKGASLSRFGFYSVTRRKSFHLRTQT
jgi:acyl-CoA reductase-like NAD-dependent aldehyde dehydrogenase